MTIDIYIVDYGFNTIYVLTNSIAFIYHLITSSYKYIHTITIQDITSTSIYYYL